MTHPVSSDDIEKDIDTKNTEDSKETKQENSQNSEDSYSDSDDDQKSTRFKDGQELTFIRVRFPGNAKSFPFLLGKRTFRYGQTVMAMSDRGMAVGYINSFPYTKKYKSEMGQIRSIAHLASREDMEKEQDLIDKEKKAEELCIRLIDKHSLNMVLTHVQYIQYGKKAVFYFTAPARVDFRELVKDLVGELKMRIELRQISVRDRAAALGAIGACGLQTCCSSFLQRYGQVSMKMAKNQNLALVPSKINGVCGQVKCCIKYEDDVYAEKRKLLPSEGTILKAANGDIGRVYRLHLIIEQFEMMTTSGARRRYARNMFDNGEVLKNYDWPDSFKHVVDETKEVIGFISEEEEHEMKMAQFEEAEDQPEGESLSTASNVDTEAQTDAEPEKVETKGESTKSETDEKDEEEENYAAHQQKHDEEVENQRKEDERSPLDRGGNNNRNNNRNRNNSRNRNNNRNRNRNNRNRNSNTNGNSNNSDGQNSGNRNENKEGSNRNNPNRNRTRNRNRNRNRNNKNRNQSGDSNSNSGGNQA